MHLFQRGLVFFGTAIAVLILSYPSYSGTDKITSEDEFLSTLRELASPLEDMSDVEEIVKRAANAKFVLLGEASHGTSEYYVMRREISKQLISAKGFDFVAVEGDWPYIYEVNLYVKGVDGAHNDGRSALQSQQRWPEWMWQNSEFLEFVEWLREYNSDLEQEQRVGLYGMDMQNMRASLDSIYKILEQKDSELLHTARENYQCLEEYDGDFQSYTRGIISAGTSCEQEVKEVLSALLGEYSTEDLARDRQLFSLKQNMMAVSYGERNARALAERSPDSWNVRVEYMKKTVDRLSIHYQDNTSPGKGIVWAHNTHVGDASATAMSQRGMVNIGQLMREDQGSENIFILGFGTYSGTVVAARQWGAQKQVLDVPEATEHSAEGKLAMIDNEVFVLFFDRESYPEILLEPIGNRAKGVVYNPESEHLGNYVPTVLPKRYDAFVFIRETNALEPLSNQ